MMTASDSPVPVDYKPAGWHVGTVSAVNIGSMFRNGWNNNIKSADSILVLEKWLQS
jgi:hypothetical protein